MREGIAGNPVRAVLNRLLRGLVPQSDAPTSIRETDGGPVLPHLRVGAMAAEIISRFAEPTIRVQVRNWTVVISLSHDGRHYSAAVDDGRIVGLRCRYADCAREAAVLSAEAASFLPRDGAEVQRVVFRPLGDGWLLALRQSGNVAGDVLGVDLADVPARVRERRYGT